MVTLHVIWLIFIVLASNIFSIFKFATKAYFGEKVKNLATKQDIAEITKQVGEINASIKRQTDLFNARNDFSFKDALALKQIEREVFLDFVVKLNQWSEGIDNVTRQYFRYENRELIRIYIENLRQLNYSYFVSRYKLDAFYHDANFLEIHRRLVNELLDKQGDAECLLIEIEALFELQGLELSKGFESSYKINAKSQNQISLLIAKYFENNKDKNKEVYKYYVQLINIVRDKIRQLDDPIS